MDTKITTLINLNRRIHRYIMLATKRKVHSTAGEDRFVHMTERQIESILTIHQMAPCTLTELARELEISLPSASSLVDALVNKGYVIRETNPKDRREVAISLKSNMNEFVTMVKQTLIETFKELSERIGRELFDEWFNIVSKISGVIYASGDSPDCSQPDK